MKRALILAVLLLIPTAALAQDEPPSEGSVYNWLESIDEIIDPRIEDLEDAVERMQDELEPEICAVTNAEGYAGSGGDTTKQLLIAAGEISTDTVSALSDPGNVGMAQAQVEAEASYFSEWYEAADAAYQAEISGTVGALDASDPRVITDTADVSILNQARAYDTDPTFREQAHTMGTAIGEPIGYLRAYQNAQHLRLSFLNLLFFFMVGSTLWIAGIFGLSSAIRLIMWLVNVAIQIIELIPFM